MTIEQQKSINRSQRNTDTGIERPKYSKNNQSDRHKQSLSHSSHFSIAEVNFPKFEWLINELMQKQINHKKR